jgi:hypothetical protein
MYDSFCAIIASVRYCLRWLMSSSMTRSSGGWTVGDDEWDRTVVVIDRLVSLGSTARMPLSKSLGDGLFGLRFALGSTARRITYRFAKNGRIVLLTTFRKQRNNERAEIARARRAAEDCARTNP